MKKGKSLDKFFALPPGEVLVIDVRSKQEFDAGHFSTAINIPTRPDRQPRSTNLNRINRNHPPCIATAETGPLLQKRSFGRMDLSRWCEREDPHYPSNDRKK